MVCDTGIAALRKAVCKRLFQVKFQRPDPEHRRKALANLLLCKVDETKIQPLLAMANGDWSSKRPTHCCVFGCCASVEDRIKQTDAHAYKEQFGIQKWTNWYLHPPCKYVYFNFQSSKHTLIYIYIWYDIWYIIYIIQNIYIWFEILIVDVYCLLLVLFFSHMVWLLIEGVLAENVGSNRECPAVTDAINTITASLDCLCLGSYMLSWYWCARSELDKILNVTPMSHDRWHEDFGNHLI